MNITFVNISYPIAALPNTCNWVAVDINTCIFGLWIKCLWHHVKH